MSRFTVHACIPWRGSAEVSTGLQQQQQQQRADSVSLLHGTLQRGAAAAAAPWTRTPGPTVDQ